MLKILFFIGFLLFLSSCATDSPTNNIGETKMKQPSQVMVLGMVHLGEQQESLSKNTESLIKILKEWHPTKIAIEDRAPEAIYKASLHATFDDGYKKLIEIFDGKDIQRAHHIYKKHGTDYLKSLNKVNQYLKKEDQLSDSDRADMVLHLLATFDGPSAILQWSKISINHRSKTSLFSKQDKESFEKILSSQNEIYSIALPLARELKHPLLYSVDSQEDGVSMVSAPRKDIELLYSNPESKTFSNSQFQKDDKSAIEMAAKLGDLLSAIDFVNKNADAYDAQWDWLLNIDQEQGLHKLRYANWEQRNIEIFSNIQKIVSTTKKERVLVLIGASHKAILDRYLMGNKSVEIVHFIELSKHSSGKATTEN